MNLKKILMELGNKLVLEHRYDLTSVPPCSDEFVSWVDGFAGSVELVAAFTVWLNRSPEAQQALAELGVEWPVVPQQLGSEVKR